MRSINCCNSEAGLIQQNTIAANNLTVDMYNAPSSPSPAGSGGSPSPAVWVIHHQ